MSQNASNRKFKIWIPLLLSLFFIAGMLIGVRLMKFKYIPQNTSKQHSDLNLQSNSRQGRVEEVLRYIDARYVDDVEKDAIVEKAIKNILKELDPHSNYISAKDLKSVNEQLQGNFEGIGVEFVILDDTLQVVSPLAGGPSDKVGIKAGDKIITVKDTTISGISISNKDVIAKLRGAKGSEVDLGIMRGNNPELIPFTVIRDEIPINSVDVSYMVDDNTGYIKINRFSATTYNEFMEAMETMVEDGLQNLILDVRQNPGGYLTEATKILNQIVNERGELLVYTEGRTSTRSTYNTNGPTHHKIENVAIMVDEGSASASEILAGAVQDLDRGTIIGRRTFGKGLVQEQYDLSDGGALRLTVAKYYTPSGRLIQKPYEDANAYSNDVNNRFKTGELSNADSISVQDSTKFFTASGRIVFGGGGVTPDIFTPLDKVLDNNFFIQARQHLNTFVYRYVDENRSNLNEFELDRFEKEFYVDEDLFLDFLAFAKKEGVKIEDKLVEPCKDDLKLRIKAIIARQLFQNKGFYKIYNSKDDAFNKALKAVRSDKRVLVE